MRLVGLAKVLTPPVERAIAKAGAPESVVRVVIAALVLKPEGLAAFRSTRANRLQASMNLALGSALASIGLTIPAVAIVSIVLDKTIDSRPRAERNCAALCDAYSEPVYIGHGKDNGVAGGCACGDVRGVRVLGSGVVETVAVCIREVRISLFSNSWAGGTRRPRNDVPYANNCPRSDKRVASTAR